jgi:hypothetical protein
VPLVRVVRQGLVVREVPMAVTVLTVQMALGDRQDRVAHKGRRVRRATLVREDRQDRRLARTDALMAAHSSC